MILFVDFDNLPPLLKGRSIREICSRLLASSSLIANTAPARARIRLYGGWYNDARKTKRAEALSRDPDLIVPFVVRLTWGSSVVSIRVSAELAYSLDADRSSDLYATFRVRSYTSRILTESAITNVCTSANCSLRIVEIFLRLQRCPDCQVAQGDFLRKAEQKLVDTMIVSDLLYHARLDPTIMLTLVSSDDDMWPGIRTAIAFGRRILHIHTKNVVNRYATASLVNYASTTL